MPSWARCSPDGPFLPGSPRSAVLLGLRRARELRLRPDRAALTALTVPLLLLLGASLTWTFLCQGLGWAQRGRPCPNFRRQQLKYNLDSYSSKIPEVFAMRKTHPSLQHQAGTGCFLRRGDAWEPEGQIDLESFNTKVFFELLLGQSRSVTTTLGQFKEEVKALYHRVMSEISSLKTLWIKALSIPGKEEEDESTVVKQQVLFSGSPLENPQDTTFYGLSGVSNNPWEFIPQKLIPLLQSVLQTLEENRKNNLSRESPGDGRKRQSSSFLLRLLEEVNDELRNHAVAAGLGLSPKLQKTGMSAQEGELAAVDPAALSPREFVVFQYGLSILQFLTLHIKAPEISLAVASSLPLSPAPGNAFRNSFFYQDSKRKLFILRDCLGSGGGFLLLLVHCLAHVTAGDLSHDSNPHFLSLFHQALKACLSEMFSLRLQLSAAALGDKAQGINQKLLKEEPFSTEEINLISQLFEVRVKNLRDMEAFEKNLLLHVKSEESLNKKGLERKKENFLHPHSSSGRNSLGQGAHLEEEAGSALSRSELEDKVDALTEELLQILEDEQQFLSSKGNEDLLSYYLEITTPEKESLVKQINELQEEIAQSRKL